MLISEFFKGGIEGVLGGVSNLIKNFKGDPLELARIEQALVQAEQVFQLQLAQAQTRINEIEASSQDKFNSRWRPAVGWSCVSGLIYDVFVRPISQSILNFWYPEYTMVVLDTQTLMTLLFGLLGLGAYRTYERVKGSVK